MLAEAENEYLYYHTHIVVMKNITHLLKVIQTQRFWIILCH